jgi:hypothetical protein
MRPCRRGAPCLALRSHRPTRSRPHPNPTPNPTHPPTTTPGYNFLNASPRYAAATKAGRLQPARDALHSDLRPLAGSAGPRRRASVVVVYDAMHGPGGGAFDREFDRRVSDAMQAIAARFPQHSVPRGHRLREMALAELGAASLGGGGGGGEGGVGGGAQEVAPGVAAVFSRDCEADTWILAEVDALAARWRGHGGGGGGGGGGGAAAAAAPRRRPRGPRDVVVVSDDNRVRDGVFFAAMSLIHGESGAQAAAAAAAAGAGKAGPDDGGGGGGGGAGLSLSVWSCAALDGALDDAARRRGSWGGGAASAAWAAAALGAPRGAAAAAGGAESDAEGGWPDGDYDGATSDDEAAGAAGGAVPAALTPLDVSALLSETGDVLAAADASLEALLAMDLGDGLLPPRGPGA